MEKYVTYLFDMVGITSYGEMLSLSLSLTLILEQGQTCAIDTSKCFETCAHPEFE